MLALSPTPFFRCQNAPWFPLPALPAWPRPILECRADPRRPAGGGSPSRDGRRQIRLGGARRLAGHGHFKCRAARQLPLDKPILGVRFFQSELPLQARKAERGFRAELRHRAPHKSRGARTPAARLPDHPSGPGSQQPALPGRHRQGHQGSDDARHRRKQHGARRGGLSLVAVEQAASRIAPRGEPQRHDHSFGRGTGLQRRSVEPGGRTRLPAPAPLPVRRGAGSTAVCWEKTSCAITMP